MNGALALRDSSAVNSLAGDLPLFRRSSVLPALRREHSIIHRKAPKVQENQAQMRERAKAQFSNPPDVLRSMLIEICGQRQWNDTRDSWLSRGARRCRISHRQARRIFYQESMPSGRAVFALFGAYSNHRSEKP